MHPLSVLVYMRDEKDYRLFEDTASGTPEEIPGWLKHALKPSPVPHGLFSRIIKRLGLEKELIIVKRYLGFLTGLLVIFLFLSVFAFIGIKHVLAESSLEPFISLIFSDPGIVIKYWHSFAYAAFESMPGVTATALFISVAFLLLFIRLAAFSFEKLFIVIRSINKQKYGHE